MRILVVDDDPDLRALAVRALHREFPDAEVEEAGSRRALETALAHGPVPDLLISDYSLNWGDGFGVLQAVRAVRADCPAIMFTGTGSEALAVRAMKAGFDDYIVKSPQQMRRMSAAARAAVERGETLRGSEENRQLLTQELYHRLHNNLQLVVGLISFTERAIADPDARAKLADLGRRVQSLSLLQERLYRGGDFRYVDFSGFLKQLVDDLLALDGRDVGASLRLDDGVVPVDVAAPLALIANELIVNTLKHAFGGDSGSPKLTVELAPIDEGGWVLEIADNGSGGAQPAEASESAGMGMRLVRRLAQQLGANVEVRAAEGGGRACRITVPKRPAGASRS